MSTNSEHIETNSFNFESIDRHVRAFDLTPFTSQAAVPASKTERLMSTYAIVRPILLGVTAIPLIPVAWRAALRIFVATLDEVTATFKAGKDLAIGDGGAVEQMEPKGPVS
jgi:hypothetical protein